MDGTQGIGSNRGLRRLRHHKKENNGGKHGVSWLGDAHRTSGMRRLERRGPTARTNGVNGEARGDSTDAGNVVGNGCGLLGSAARVDGVLAEGR